MGEQTQRQGQTHQEQAEHTVGARPWSWLSNLGSLLAAPTSAYTHHEDTKAPKTGEAWSGERTFEGQDEYGTHFRLTLSRDAQARLHGVYQVKGKGQPEWGEAWKVRGTLYHSEESHQDSLLLEAPDNAARFLGTRLHLGSAGLSIEAKFQRHTYSSKVELHESANVPPQHSTQPTKQSAPAAKWTRTFAGQVDEQTLQLHLSREGTALSGTFALGTAGSGTLSGKFEPQQHLVQFEALYTQGARQGQKRLFQGVLEEDSKDADHDRQQKELALRGLWHDREQGKVYQLRAVQQQATIEEGRPDTAPASPALSSSAKPWSETLAPHMREKLPALQEPKFLEELTAMCGRLGVPRDMIMAVMNFESANHELGSRGLDPRAENQYNHAFFGLIQFGEQAIADMGNAYGKKWLKTRGLPVIDRASDMKGLSATEQLPYVELYLIQHGLDSKRRGEDQSITLEHVYMTVLGGSARLADKPIWVSDDPSLSGRQGDPYDQNIGLDSDHNHNITPQEAADMLRIRWRANFGTHLDGRSRHLSMKQQSGREQLTYNDLPIDDMPLNLDSSHKIQEEQDNTTPKDTSKEHGDFPAPHLEERPFKERQNLLKRGRAARGEVLGSLDGVESYFNARDTGSYKEYSKSPDSNYDFGMKWQCVEFVRRYYYEVLGHQIRQKGDAASYIDSDLKDGEQNSSRGLTQFLNGSEHQPQYRDLLVLRPSAENQQHGHVAIVTSVTNDTVKIAQQNYEASFTDELKIVKRMRGGKERWYVEKALGWLRK